MASNNLQPALPLAQRGGDLLRNVLGPFLALVFVVGVFTIADNLQTDGGRFATLKNAQNVLVQSATVAVAALGMTMIIISAGIDLALRVVARDHGESVARATARHMEYPYPESDARRIKIPA